MKIVGRPGMKIWGGCLACNGNFTVVRTYPVTAGGARTHVRLCGRHANEYGDNNDMEID